MGHEDSDERTPLVLESGSARGACEDMASLNSNSTNVAGPHLRSESAQEVSTGSNALSGAATFNVNKLVTMAVGSAASLMYISLSASMILFNKFLMRDNVFPFPVPLTTLHMACSLFMAFWLQRLCPSFFPAYSRVFAKKSADLDSAMAMDSQVSDNIRRVFHALLPFAPIAACGAVCLVAGNSAYRYASVSFLQMVKESHIMFVYFLMVVVGLDKFKLRMAAVIVFVACSAMVAVYGEVYFSWTGLLLQLLSGLSGSGQIVLNNLLMSRSSMGKIDPLTLVFCTAPVMLIALLPFNIVFWDARIIVLAKQWSIYIFFNALLAFTLQISAATLIWVTSGTGYALACVAKDLAIVAAAQVILHESFTGLQVMGFTGSIAGMVIYSAMKLFPEAFESTK